MLAATVMVAENSPMLVGVDDAVFNKSIHVRLVCCNFKFAEFNQRVSVLGLRMSYG
jgi:hypothetical protein